MKELLHKISGHIIFITILYVGSYVISGVETYVHDVLY